MTIFRDMWATDERGEKFLFTVEMQRQLSERGLPIEPANVSQLKEARSYESAAPSKPRSKPVFTQDRKPVVREEFKAPESIQIDPETGKYIGRMKWYNMRKGYGFIVRGGGEEIFFHKSGAVGDPTELKEGQWILYDVEETHKGPEATDIEPYAGDVDLLA